MDFRRLLRLSALVALAGWVPVDAYALGLARARGAVILGRPLNITIPATVEPGDPDTPCVEADVFQGDTRVLPRNVITRWESGAPGQGQVRVFADVAVEEPVVTLYIRVGCTNKITRRYVLLSEQPTEEPPASMPSQVFTPAPRAALPQPPTTAPVTPPAFIIAEPLRIQPTPRLAQPQPQRPAAAAERRSRAAQPQAQAPAARRTPAGERLKLEPLDLAAERDPSLKTSQRLLAQPTNDEERRRQAAALWRAITAGPEEAMRNSERIMALERDVRSLSELTRRNAAALELMREQTEKARGERNVMAQVAVALALLIALAAVAFAWAVRKNSAAGAAWWGGRADERESEFDSEMPSRAAGSAAAAARAATLPPKDSQPGRPADSSPLRPPEHLAPAPPSPAFVSSRAWANSDFQGSYPGSGARMLKAEELIDIQQQADFFLSIGQPERAITLLETHLQQQSETSALAWFDLLDIYHSAGQREDYDRIRSGFHERFNAHVPEFEDYHSDQGGLEDYGRALSRIMSLWPSSRVLEVIEDSLLRKPGTADSETFGLEAYRELVLLYNIAKEVAQDEEREEDRTSAPQRYIVPADEVQPSRFGETQRMGLLVKEPPAPPVPAKPLLSADELSFAPAPKPDVDIDLGDPGEAAPDEFDLMLDSAEPRSSSDDEWTKPDVAPAATPAPTPSPAPITDLDSLDWRSLR